MFQQANRTIVVFNNKLGFRRPGGNQVIFDVELYNGEILSFDTNTGEVINLTQNRLKPVILLNREQ